MAKVNENPVKFKTMIGGQALIEGIMMRGPEKDSIVVRTKNGLETEVHDRKLHPDNSPLKWPFIRGVVNFFDAQVVGVKALMRSADLAPDDAVEESSSKFDKWLEKKLGDKRFQNFMVGSAIAVGVGLSILIFFLVPMILGSLFEHWVKSNLGINLIEGLIRMVIFLGYMALISRMPDMRRVFSYHGAEHKTISCYEAGDELTVENVRKHTRFHPRCGTSFLLVVMVISIVLFSIASSLLLSVAPGLEAMKGTLSYNLIMMAFKLLLLPLVVSVSYEFNRWAGRNDNAFTRILVAPGLWFQRFTTREPDDSMIEVGITAFQAVLPREEGADRW